MQVLCKNQVCRKNVEVARDYAFCPYCGSNYMDSAVNVNQLLEQESKAIKYRFKNFMIFYVLDSGLFIGLMYYLLLVLKMTILPGLVFLGAVVWACSILVGLFFISRLPKARGPAS